MYRGSSIELNALGESLRCKKGLKIGYCMFGSRQGIPSRNRVLSGSMSRQEFLCRDMVLRFLVIKAVATWLSLLQQGF